MLDSANEHGKEIKCVRLLHGAGVIVTSSDDKDTKV